MRFNAHLRNVAFEAALALGLAAPALPQQKAIPLTERQQTFDEVIGAGDDWGAFGFTPARAFLKLAFGQWPVPGINYDPEIPRSISLNTYTQFDRGEKDYHAVTRASSGFRGGTPDILNPGYLQKERQVFSSAQVEANLVPVDTPQGANLGILIEAHEAAHALHARRLALTELLGLSAPLQNIGQSRYSGHGPTLEALLQEGETPKETALRHKHLQEVSDNKDPNADDSSSLEYPLFYTEIRSYLVEALAAPIAAQVWSRLPQSRGELWAAFANIVGEVPSGDNEVTRFLNSPEGLKATADFPLILNGPASQDARFWLKKGYAFIKPDQQAEYFAKVLPEIYGELLEDFGDPQGMVKMGLPASPVHAFAFADHLIDRNPETGEWTAAEWERRAREVEPAAFERLCELALVHHQSLALEALLDTEKTVPGHVLSADTKNSLLGKAQEMAGWGQPDLLAKFDMQRNIALLQADGATLPLPSEPRPALNLNFTPRILFPSPRNDFQRPNFLENAPPEIAPVPSR